MEHTPNENEQVNSTPVDVMPSTEALLKQAELQAKEHYDAWMYAKAESENIRRRGQEEISKAQKFAV